MNNSRTQPLTGVLVVALAAVAARLFGAAPAEPLRLESPAILVEVEHQTGRWWLRDKASGVRWPSEGMASAGEASGLQGDVLKTEVTPAAVRVTKKGATVTFALVDQRRSLEIRYEGEGLGGIRALEDAMAVTAAEKGCVVVPCREGLLIPADAGVAFRQVFGTSEYEGCHMNMLGVLKNGSALVVSWRDADTWAEIHGEPGQGGPSNRRITSALTLKGNSRSFRLTPLGRGDWNTLAAGYRRIAEDAGLAVTLREKIRRNERAERLVGAANVKLWMCLARRMNEESTKQESVAIRWTFDEAAAIAEHLHKDLNISRCLFVVGGWTEGGYDCRHPDNLPANPECGGNAALAHAMRSIQRLGFIPCLHDNYQDIYRDARSWNPDVIERRPDGSLVQGGRWMGGRAYMVCAPKQLELALRPENLPAIRELFDPWCYFIDTTFAVGPRQCAAPDHPLGRNDDIAWKIKLSDKARELFGLFGSECGREWALPHSDFFEGLVGVSGRYYHNLKPQQFGAVVIPFWEMVYHDCQICYGKYGYPADQAAEYVAHHVLCARPLNYHSIPDHRYWLESPAAAVPSGDRACFTRTDRGWAEGLHRVDAFLKTTHEVLGPLHEATAHQRLTRLEFLTPDRAVRRAVYGEGGDATTVVVNFGAEDATLQSRFGGDVVLSQWGFVVDSPRLAAFYAKRWGGREYPQGALFTLRAEHDAGLHQARRLRVFHGFGDPFLRWHDKECEVRREETIQLESD